MAIQFSYEVYRFQGKLIDKKNYEEFKNAFTANPYLDFPEPKSYFEEHKGESLLVIICFGVSLVLLPFGEIIEGTVLMGVLGLAIFAFFLSVTMQSKQYITFQKARRRHKYYLIELKKDIIQSSNYEEFISLQRPKIYR